MDVEESICAPQFGLKGRIDATLNIRISGESREGKRNFNSGTNHSGKMSVSSRSTRSGYGRNYPSLKQGTTGTDCKDADFRQQFVPLEFKTGKKWYIHEAQVTNTPFL